ncbi:MAG: MerR family transcriptional regulator [Actinomycetota bacterium]|nr:MerR family transcriptional regulator [Actinomycetota bacterium]
MEHLLTIGAFGGRCGLSPSALRFYDQCGLLRPVAVDDSTGYRYYSADQVPDAELVRRLREAEMPMAAVSGFLAAGPIERVVLLDEHATNLEERAASVRRAISEVRSRLGDAEQEEAWGCVVATERLAKALDEVRFAVGGEGRAELAVIWVETRDDSVRVVATDSFRMVVRDVVASALRSDAAIRVALPVTVADELRSTLAGAGGVVRIRQTPGGAMEAEVGGRLMHLVTAAEPFPDYEALLAGLPGGHRGVVSRHALVNAVASERGAAATLVLGGDGLRVRGGAHGRDELVGGFWDGPALSITVNPVFVSEALASLVGPDVIIEASDALRPIVLRSADDSALSVWTMPIRSTQ